MCLFSRIILVKYAFSASSCTTLTSPHQEQEEKEVWLNTSNSGDRTKRNIQSNTIGPHCLKQYYSLLLSIGHADT
jgi:hypothetical protein